MLCATFLSQKVSVLAVTHGWSAIKPKLSKSAFSEGVRHFERQFQVDGDVARNRSMDRWIGEWCSYNVAAGSFHTKKLCSRLFTIEVEFYWHIQRYRVFVPPFGGLRGNVHGLSTGWAKKVIPLVQCNVMHERYHFFGPACIWLVGKRVVDFL